MIEKQQFTTKEAAEQEGQYWPNSKVYFDGQYWIIESEEIECYQEQFKEWTDDMGGRYCTATKISWNSNVTDVCDSCPFQLQED